jgi:hypothetical protein
MNASIGNIGGPRAPPMMTIFSKMLEFLPDLPAGQSLPHSAFLVVIRI